MNVGATSSLLVRFVEEVLNGHSIEALPEIVSPNFVDHDPIEVHGPTGQRRMGLAYLEDLVRFLDLPVVDVRFELEDLLEDGDRIAYRLFGEGVIRVDVGSLARGGAVTVGARPPESQVARLGELREGLLLGEMLHTEYSGVGIFRVESGRLRERWGAVHVR
jgi:SnoaL-like domain